MNDRALLELAAKAAGLEGSYMFRVGGKKGSGFPYDLEGIMLTSGAMWNPLRTDGDNRRLQVKLRLGLVPLDGGGWDCITWDHDDEVTLATDFDPNRAVVLAAAAIGKEM